MLEFKIAGPGISKKEPLEANIEMGDFGGVILTLNDQRVIGINKSGGFFRYPSLQTSLGLQLDDEGRIEEAEPI